MALGDPSGAGAGAGLNLPGGGIPLVGPVNPWVSAALLALAGYSLYSQRKQQKKAQHEREEQRDTAADEARARELQIRQEQEQRAADAAAAAEEAKVAGIQAGRIGRGYGRGTAPLSHFSGVFATGFGGAASASSEQTEETSGGLSRRRLFGN